MWLRVRRRPRADPGDSAQCRGARHDQLFHLHIVNGVEDTANAKPRLPKSRERHPVDAKGGMVVDHHRGGVDTRRRPQRGIDVARKHGGLKGSRQPGLLSI